MGQKPDLLARQLNQRAFGYWGVPLWPAAAAGLAIVLALGVAMSVLAQGNGLAVSITGVEDGAFPQVMAYVAAANDSGPLTQLDDVKVALTEEGAPLPPEAVTLEKVDNLDLRLVLAVDLSMPETSLAEVKGAIGTLLDQLGPRDRAAVVIFQDAAAVAHGFTNNTEELRAVAASLSPGGNYTAMHQGIFEAVALADSSSEGRKAVIVISDSRNNTGDRSVDEIVGQAQAAGVSLWPVGIGSRASSPLLESMASRTTGKAYLLAGAGQVEEALLAAEALLRQGYRVTFQSGLPADGAEHGFTVAMAGAGSPVEAPAGQVQAVFVAAPGPVTITLPDVSEGQKIRSVVTLNPVVAAPGPLAYVEYALDEQVLARVETPPYSYEWNSAGAEPGAHRLVIRAADTAGNEGQMAVGVVVQSPLLVNVSTPQDEVAVGDQLAIGAQIDSLAGIARVDFMLDGQVMDTAEAPPYAFSLSSSQYRPGVHVITVRVEDSAGYQAESSLTIRFLPAPPLPEPEPGWGEAFLKGLMFLGTGLVALVIAGAAVIALRAIVARQRRNARRRYGLVISNAGNIRSRYELKAEDPARALQFAFNLDGQPLSYRRATEPVMAVAPAGQAPVRAAAPGPEGRQARAAPPNGRGAGQSVNQAMQTTNAVADVLNSFVNLLPSSLTGSMRGTVGQVRQGQSAVRNVQKTSRKVNQFTGAASRPAQAPAAPVQEVGRPVRPSAPAGRIAVNTWTQTPFVEPGQALTVDLFIDPVDPFKAQERSFFVSSRPVDQEQATPVTGQALIYLPGLSWLRRFTPVIIVILLALAVMGGIGYGLFWWLNAGA